MALVAGSCPEPITDAAYRLSRVMCELVPEVADVHLDHVGAILIAVVPDVLEQLEPGQDLARTTHEQLEHRELARRQRQLTLPLSDHARGRIEPQIAYGQLRRSRQRPAPDQRADPGHQLLEGERLCPG